MLAALRLPASAANLPAHSSGSLCPRRVAVPPRGPRREPVGRRVSLRSTCSLGGSVNSMGSDSDDGYDLSLNRELERRTGKYKSLAAHLDLLYNASQASSSSIQTCQCCRGTGEQECNWCHGTGAMTVGDMLYCSEGGCTPCPVCRGTGQCKCPKCCGTGKRASWLAQRPPS